MDRIPPKFCMAANGSHRSTPSLSPLRLLKTRTGCATCKARKLKCDEAQPHCRRCQKAGWKCPGYGQATAGRLDHQGTLISHAQLSDVSGRTWRERRSFEYYFRHSGRAIAGPLDTRFWHGIVLQLCRSEPAVWDAVIAISALYECPDPFLGPPMVMPTTRGVAKHREPLGWYFRSMASMRQRIYQNKAGAFLCLVTCLLYLCLEIMQGHMVEALRLYEQGIQLIRAVQQRPVFRSGSYEGTVVEEVIIPMFFRLGASALISAGYPVQDPFMSRRDDDRKDETAKNALCIPMIDSLRAAMVSLNMEAMNLVRSAYEYFHATIDNPNGLHALTNQQQALHLKLQEWKLVFTTFQDRHPQTNPAASVLLIFHIAATIMVSTCLSQHQLPFDDHKSQFQHLVHHAQIALMPTSDLHSHRHCPFTFETGPGLPLYYAVVKCRDPTLRREALALLKQAPQVQAFFKCPSWIQLAEMAIQLEEGHVRGLRLKLHTRSYTGYASPSTSPSITTTDETNFPNDPNPQEWLAVADLAQDPPVIHELLGLSDIDEASFFRPQTENSASPPSSPIPEEQRLRGIGVVTAYRCDGSVLDRNRFNENGAEKANLLRQMGQDEVFFQFTRNRLDPASGEWIEDRFFMGMDGLTG